MNVIGTNQEAPIVEYKLLVGWRGWVHDRSWDKGEVELT